MANLQKQFLEFHDRIKFDPEEDEQLRTSRDAIITKLKEAIKKLPEDTKLPVPEFFNQGSYAMGTGTLPWNDGDDYDIDVGVKFDLFTTEHPDPLEIKKILKDSLDDHTKDGAEIKEPCVRIKYQDNHHVDLAIYATNGLTSFNDTIYLGRGKESSQQENRHWQEAQPQLLLDKINNKFTDPDESAQFRRIIRYLKRWKDVNFTSLGNNAPRGIALTISAYEYFSPILGNDMPVLRNLIQSMLSSVQMIRYDEETSERIVGILPVAPSNDLYSKMSNNQMHRFIEKLTKLEQTLNRALNEQDEENATGMLAEVFGDDFPFAEEEKLFVNVRKPKIGVYGPYEEVSDEQNVPIRATITGYVMEVIPFTSNGKVVKSGLRLKYHANIVEDVIYDEIRWRVRNTGRHAESDSGFRGKLHRAKEPLVNYGPVIKAIPRPEYKNSTDILTTYESTKYSGKHWIECFAFKNGVCIAKSSPFYINIFNPDFDSYE